MSDYTKITDFAAKDALPTGDPLKRGKGTEVDEEFNAIEVAIATKADKASPALTGTPTAPTPGPSAGDSEVTTVEYVRDQLYAVVPIGTVIMWGGATGIYPAGWELCDGSTYTRSDGAGDIVSPDLRDRFVVAAGTARTEKSTGGVDSHSHTTATSGGHNHGGSTGATTLTINEMPAHTHTFTRNVYPNNSTGGAPHGWTDGTASGSQVTTTDSTGGGAAHSHTISTDGDHSHSVNSGSNVPAYYALAFLIRI